MIDPKELRIGAHYYNGSYNEPIIGRVLSINGSINNPDDMSVGLIYDMPLDNDSDPYEAAMLPYLEPIPITEELLTELGFEKVTLQTRPKPIIQYVDAESIKAQAEDLNVRVVPRITIQYINVTNPFWSVSAYGEKMEDNKMTVRYLHELEQFLYLTTKTELIKE